MTYVGTHIPGFRKVHLGFKFVACLFFHARSLPRIKPSTFRERVFPEDCSKYGGLRPYDTISKGVQALALWLYRRNPERGKVSPGRATDRAFSQDYSVLISVRRSIFGSPVILLVARRHLWSIHASS